ncbi:MAG TPA: BON domain-containing protein [Rhizobacter sp.]
MNIVRHGVGAALCLALATTFATVSGCATHDTTVGQKFDDTVITTKVKSALLGDPDVKGTAISVETVGGNVMLSGFVNSQAQRSRALDIAGRVEGVGKVVDKLSIKE